MVGCTACRKRKCIRWYQHAGVVSCKLCYLAYGRLGSVRELESPASDILQPEWLLGRKDVAIVRIKVDALSRRWHKPGDFDQ